MADRRVEALTRAAIDDVRKAARTLQAAGWPVHIHVDTKQEGSALRYTVALVITVIPIGDVVPAIDESTTSSGLPPR
jgi:hypothetical protein